MQRSFWKRGVGVLMLIALAACGQPQSGATEPAPAASQAPVALSGSGGESGASQAPVTLGGGGTDTQSSGGAVTMSHGGPLVDHVSFVDHLRAKGLMVEPVESVQQPFLRAEGTNLRLSGGELKQPAIVQSYDYQSADEAAADASQIGPDGNPKTAMVEWRGTPHLFRKERVLAIYVGDDQAVLSVLNELLGPQFAGR